MERLLIWWLRREKWSKGFYLTLALAFVGLSMLRWPPIQALTVALMWAAMVAGALWVSEKLKDRMRGGTQGRTRRRRR